MTELSPDSIIRRLDVVRVRNKFVPVGYGLRGHLYRSLMAWHKIYRREKLEGRPKKEKLK